MRITNKEIRDYYGHNGHECKVKIKRNGEIHRFGSPTVCINEEGNAGVYCVDCGEKICDDC